ncbi:hypothetical protein [Pelagicoccus sp. SDUM812005]|uniref:hypothetical protein n=1 Tax=Pelagicoccus sp. SDUM812005 TaxID=3041257 RepID=UPI0028103C06|nr:hypothetical protein [Pelagicoccus sp. SDUM812005]MDQ8179145.1 hypothetical protein [Pelagicoccus sp. SDUM812005]
MKEGTTGLLSLSALLCSAVALAVSFYDRFEEAESAEENHLERIEELERELAYLQGGGYHPRGSAYGSGSQAAETDETYSRFNDSGSGYLESDVEEMRWTMAVRGFMPATADHVDRARRSMFDEEMDAKSKLAALRILRMADGLDDDVVRATITAFHSTDDPRVQEDFLELLDGVTTPELAPTLLKVTAEHLNYRVRRQALDAMSGFLPDPELEDWLRFVEKNDGSRRVREEATRTLRQLAEAAAKNK